MTRSRSRILGALLLVVAALTAFVAAAVLVVPLLYVLYRHRFPAPGPPLAN
jgi:ABC-type sulfate transport system permease component